MKNLNKKIRMMGGMICAILAFSAVTPRPANAWILTVGDDNILGSHSDGAIFGSALICVIFLPFCLLDQKVPGAAGTTAADLAANGYTSAQIQTILADQSALTSRLSAQRLQLKVGPTDTRESLLSQIRSVYPRVSDTYLEFAADASGLK